MKPPLQLTRTHKTLIGAVTSGAVVVAGIGFAGSYAAVQKLALKKGFGSFAYVFPIGIDAGIGVLLALDLLLCWIRIPFPVLRHIAWLLTAATIAFNGAAAWPDPLGVGMHAVIPVLFVITVEAARHAVGRIADITADKDMDGVRITRWLLSPAPTFKLWRRMKLWELRSYEQAVGMEQDRLVYRARLQARYGRAWRRKAPVEAVIPLRLAKLGVPLAQTAPAGLAAAGILIEWRPSEPSAPAFEEHAETALDLAATPALPPIRTVIPSPAVAFAADKPKRPREEVSARIPLDDAEGLDDCEADTHEEDTQEAEQENLQEDPADTQDTQAGDPADESTNPQAAPACPPPDNSLAARNARAAQDAAKRRLSYAQGWQKAQQDTPGITQAEFAERLGISPRTLRRALTENTAVLTG
ncbi:DUF2637 domain-containing protein [Streptomyces sp. WAC07149]|uniref:DUF2637 domain-containing protein n=1 Tax=Streptomyces sp. WAC07149 TaxID=2487425 RepID=UPI000F78D91F|nr:DUF2637 domain-containing protein [Streptomyces sp. WAC07149]RST00385.1 DUF2637 domain-containing protein [Streptomyces sp. WAC07149]